MSRRSSARNTDPIDPDDAVLVLVQQGKLREATQLLMERYGTAMYRYAGAQLRDSTLADDVVQTIFIQAMRDLPRFEASSTLRVWLFAIARHRVLDAVKKRRRALSHFEDDADADAPAALASAGDAIDDARLGRLLYRCLDKLNDKARTAVLMHYLLGFTFEEMAKVCGEKPGTLHARVARALEQLRTSLARACAAPGKPIRLP